MYWLYWLFILILLAAAVGAAVLAYRTYVMGETSMPKINVGGWLFRPKPEPRLGVIEQASVEARRQLVLIPPLLASSVSSATADPRRCGDRDRHSAVAPRARSQGRRRAVSSRLHAPAAQSRPSRQRMKQAYFRRQLLFLLAALLGAMAWVACKAAC